MLTKISMKKVFCVLTAIVLLCFAAFGCSNRPTTKTGTNATLYFVSAEKNELKSETRLLPAGDLLETTLAELLKGPVNTALVRIIPDGTKLKEVSMKDDTVLVDLSDEFNHLNGPDRLLARYSISNTLFEIEGVKKVKMFVDGVELKNSAGEPVGEISKNDVITTPAASSAKNVSVTLYFPINGDTNLSAEKRSAPLVDNSVEKTVITELIKGPSDNKYGSSIPAETKLISVETKDGICFVNLSGEFVTKHNGGSAGEMVTVYSIVNSLTELSNVQKVQFLIDGNKIAVYKHMTFNEPIERNTAMIK